MGLQHTSDENKCLSLSTIGRHIQSSSAGVDCTTELFRARASDWMRLQDDNFGGQNKNVNFHTIDPVCLYHTLWSPSSKNPWLN